MSSLSSVRQNGVAIRSKMHRSVSVLMRSIILLTMLATGSSAQNHFRLAGRWIRTGDRGAASGKATTAKRNAPGAEDTLLIVQESQALTITHSSGRTRRYSLDGRETANEFQLKDRLVSAASTARWSGDHLILTDRVRSGDDARVLSVSLWLSLDGTLVSDNSTTSSTSPPLRTRAVYRRMVRPQ